MNKKKKDLLQKSANWKDAIFYDSNPTKEEIEEWKRTVKFLVNRKGTIQDFQRKERWFSFKK
ncbi:MAG: hypothetical protein HOJ35_09135 [Bdellovibrionales bacterium]|jgi:hypothetical protein|nr:hypothetical protein [Bdellovibrionales bacterium]